MKGRVGEFAMALLVLVVGGLSLYGSGYHRYYTEFGPDAGFFPFWLGLAQTILGVALLVSALRGRIGSAAAGPFGSRRQIAAAALFVAYVVLLDVVGFAIATALFVFAVTFGVEPRSWREAAVYALGMTAATVALFGWAFSIPLPEGLF